MKGNLKFRKYSQKIMSDNSYLSSLKNKEFLILEKLCNNSISQTEKEEFESELKQVRLEIKKLE